MAYYFRIHKGTEAQNSSTGWNKTDIIRDDNTGIQSIDDTIDQIPASGKVGTSIPTPLARIYLFNTAFEALKDVGVKNKTYEQLVSDCLDLLQFLFEKGNDPDLRFYDININAVAQKMKDSRFEGDKVLADSLELAVSGNKNFECDLFVIEYKGMVIGGTSPFTMVYTSPNIRREIMSLGLSLDFMSNQKIELFGRTITKIEDRPKEFKEYLQQLYNHVTCNANNVGAEKLPFFMYIVKKLGTCGHIENYTEIYPAITTSTGSVVSNIYSELSYDNAPFDASGSDFLMNPTLSCDRPPLVLPKVFVPSQSQIWTYVDSQWNENTRINDADCCTDVKNRKLPKNGGDSSHESSIQYPWVSNCDFFNDNLIDLGYNVNTDKFFYPTYQGENDFTFFLPIKREYFKYFTIEDLKKNLSIKNMIVDTDANVPQNVPPKRELKSISFSLTIPLKSSKGSISLERKYVRNGEDYSIIKMLNPIGLGVFPFYKIINGKDAVRKSGYSSEYYCNVKNEYSIYLFNRPDIDKTVKKPSLKFYNCDNQVDILALEVERTRNAAGVSTIYNIRPDSAREGNAGLTTFDLIELSDLISDSQDKAILIPMLKEVTSSANKDKTAILAVDFGTSNTHAAYWSYESARPQPLEISPAEQQMVLLNKPEEDEKGVKQYRSEKSLKRASEMYNFLREFVPPIIGNEKLNKGVSYPIKTATLQGKKQLSSPTLFGSVNIGYDIDNEEVTLTDDFNYKTDLKWALQRNRDDDDARVRIHMFCEETLWLLKNIIVLKDMSNTGVKLRYFYPESMMRDDQEMFKEEWAKCADEIFTNCGFECDDIKPISESVAPYYSLLRRNGDLLNYNSINIDIGGGTTDVFFFDRGMDQGMKLNGFDSSILFAANDIWGQGFSRGDEPKNGFVKYMEDIIPSLKGKRDDLVNLYDNFSIKSPESLSGFFFKHEGFGFGDKIKNVPEFRFLLFLHYSSIIYYVADMIKCVRERELSKFSFPRVLTFTGKGSEYIKLLTPNSDYITKLTQGLFYAFGIAEEELSGFKVQYPDNPKTLTADGGIYSCRESEVKAEFVLKDEISFEMNTDPTKKCEYQQIGKYLLGYDTSYDDVLDINKLLADTPHYRELIMRKFELFVNSIFNCDKLCAIAKNIGIDVAPKYKGIVLESAKISLEKQMYRYLDEHKDNLDAKVEGTLFFLTLKNSIIDMSYQFYEKNNGENKKA